MASIGLAASDPMVLWEFASHIRAITVIGITVRLVAPTVPTGRGASDPTGLRSFAGHINGNNPAAADCALAHGRSDNADIPTAATPAVFLAAAPALLRPGSPPTFGDRL